jgi:hypothetical protein
VKRIFVKTEFWFDSSYLFSLTLILTVIIRFN